MPPNSMLEWIVGHNVPRRKPRRPQPRRRLSFEVSTDDESGSDVYKITLPVEKRATAKKVRFAGQAPRSALKVPKGPPKPATVEPAELSPEVSTDTGNESSAGEEAVDEKVDTDCPCVNCNKARKKHSSDQDNAKAIHSQHKEKKVKQAEEAKSRKARQKNKQKGKKKQQESESESEAAETTDTEPETEESAEQSEKESEEDSEKESEDDKPKNKGKKKDASKKKQTNPQKNNNGKKQDTKKNKKNQKQKSDEEKNKTASESEPEPEPEPEPKPEPPKAEKKKEKKSKKVAFPPHHPPPEIRQGNFLLPTRSHILHVEHAVEAPDDPRPNAFYDNENGVMRVYHGPAYGNPYGALYPKRVYSHQQLPIGTPHPMYNPWYNGFQTVAGQPVPPHVPPQTPMQPIRAPQRDSPDASRWFQGYGMTTPAAEPDIPPPPDFEAGFDKKRYEKLAEKYSPSPPKKSKEEDKIWDSNVLPFPIIDGSPSPLQGSDKSKVSDRSNKSKAASTSGATKKMDTNKLWGSQSASGSKKGSNNGGKKDDKTTSANTGGVFDSTDQLRKSLQETMEKDLADVKQREERWSTRSGSKEASPQQNINNGANHVWGADESWGFTAVPPRNRSNGQGDNTRGSNRNTTGDWGNNAWGNNNNGNAWGNTAWGDGTNDATNTGAADNTWRENNKDKNIKNSAEPKRVFQWVGEDPNTAESAPTDWNEVSKSNTPGSPLKNVDDEASSTPIPGGWFSPPKTTRSLSNKVPSNASGGNVVGAGDASYAGSRKESSPAGKSAGNSKNNNNGDVWGEADGWGDMAAAQSTGGFWEKDGKGKEKETMAAPNNSPSQW